MPASWSFRNNCANVVLCLGPMYHLQEPSDRLTALREAWRVLKPGETFFAAFISRFASLMDGARQNLIRDNEFAAMVNRDLKTGCHYNASGNPEYFTDAYFHHPSEAKAELAQTGFTQVRLLA